MSVKDIKNELNFSDEKYYAYEQAYFLSRKKDKPKEVKAERINRQAGMSSWLNAKLGVR